MEDLPVVTLLLLLPICVVSYKVSRLCDACLTGGPLTTVARGMLITMARFFEESVADLEAKRKAAPPPSSGHGKRAVMQ